MGENLLTTGDGEPIGTSDTYNSDTNVIGLKLDILGKELNFSFDVGQEQARLADIVPLARTICTKITQVVVESIRSEGGRIPCCKGCASCCGPYLVPLSIPEALWLKEEISAAPSDRHESMFKACLLASQRILSQKPPESFIDKTKKLSHANPVDLNLVSDWYSSFKLPCPFLNKNECTIYEQRPLACREHFVNGSSEVCRGRQGIAEVVKMPLQLPNALAQLAGELEGTTPEAVIFPLALLWCQENPKRAKRTWPKAMMVRRFVEIVETMASKNSIAAVA